MNINSLTVSALWHQWRGIFKRGCLWSLAAPEGSTEGAQRVDVTDKRATATAQQKKPRSIRQSSVCIHKAGPRWRTDTLRQAHRRPASSPQLPPHSCRYLGLFRHSVSSLPWAPGNGGMISTDSPPSPPPPAPPVVGVCVPCQSSELWPGCGPRCSARLRCLRPCLHWAPAWQVRRCCYVLSLMRRLVLWSCMGPTGLPCITL